MKEKEFWNTVGFRDEPTSLVITWDSKNFDENQAHDFIMETFKIRPSKLQTMINVTKRINHIVITMQAGKEQSKLRVHNHLSKYKDSLTVPPIPKKKRKSPAISTSHDKTFEENYLTEKLKTQIAIASKLSITSHHVNNRFNMFVKEISQNTTQINSLHKSDELIKETKKLKAECFAFNERPLINRNIETQSKVSNDDEFYNQLENNLMTPFASESEYSLPAINNVSEFSEFFLCQPPAKNTATELEKQNDFEVPRKT